MSDRGKEKKAPVLVEEGSNKDSPPRRQFLKGVAAATGAAVTMPALFPIPGLSRLLKGVIVYRLQVRGTRSCNACANHHKHKIFLTRRLADENRAHPGCDCPITTQRISKRKFRQLFILTGAINSGIVDLRQI